MRRLLLLPIVMAFSALASPAYATSITLSVLQDTYISSAQPTTNFGTEDFLIVSANNTSLLQFNLTALPAGLQASDVVSATATLPGFVSDAGQFDLFLVTSSWSESTLTFNPKPTTSPLSLNNPVTALPITLDLTSVVRNWVANPATNFGLELAVSSAMPVTSFFINSKESEAVAASLAVTFNDPTGTAAVPEPASILLLGTSLIRASFRRYRRRK